MRFNADPETSDLTQTMQNITRYAQNTMRVCDPKEKIVRGSFDGRSHLRHIRTLSVWEKTTCGTSQQCLCGKMPRVLSTKRDQSIGNVNSNCRVERGPLDQVATTLAKQRSEGDRASKRAYRTK